MYYSICQIWSAENNYIENTRLSTMRPTSKLKELTILSISEHFHLWASNDSYVWLKYLSPQPLGQLSKAQDVKFPGHCPSTISNLFCISWCAIQVFLCVSRLGILLNRVQIRPLYNTIKGFVYMHPITHTYKQAVLALHAVWDDKNNHTS